MNYKKLLIFVLILLLTAVAVFCAWQIISTELEHHKQQSMFDDLLPENASSDKTDTDANSPADDSGTGESDTQQTVDLDTAYKALFDKYEDMVAYISIADTILNYPVMQTPDWPNYYLRRNFEGEYSTYGVPYMNELCDLDESDNLIIYGHSMKNGEMFGSLLDYEKKSYWEEHPTIQLRTPSEVREYAVLGVFEIDLASGDPNIFDYNSFVNAYTESGYNEYIRQVKAHAFYDTGVTAAPGDQLLTLSTCEYELRDGRFVVVAVRTA